MNTKEAIKEDFLFAGHPVKVRICGDGNQAHAEISGFNLDAPLTADQLTDLSHWLQMLSERVDMFERSADA